MKIAGKSRWIIGALALAASHAAMAQEDVLARNLQGCENSYQQAFRMVCSAPVRARNPGIYQRCLDQIAGHKERCITNAHARYENWKRRSEKFRR